MLPEQQQGTLGSRGPITRASLDLTAIFCRTLGIPEEGCPRTGKCKAQGVGVGSLLLGPGSPDQGQETSRLRGRAQCHAPTICRTSVALSSMLSMRRVTW